MKKTVLGLSLSTILLAAPISAYSQTLWQDSEKGMTVEQVKQNFPNAIEPSTIAKFHGDAKALLEIPEYKIGMDTFKVQFVFKESELDIVRMVKNGGSAQVGFSNMKKLLKTKYGEPLDTTSNDLFYSITWLDNGTSISLSNSLNNLIIIYRADDAKEANKL